MDWPLIGMSLKAICKSLIGSARAMGIEVRLVLELKSPSFCWVLFVVWEYAPIWPGFHAAVVSAVLPVMSYLVCT